MRSPERRRGEAGLVGLGAVCFRGEAFSLLFSMGLAFALAVAGVWFGEATRRAKGGGMMREREGIKS